MQKILTYDDAMRLVGVLYDNEMGEYGLKILVEVPNREMFRKVDEEFFYRLNRGMEYSEHDQNTDIVVKIGGVTFIYRLVENEDNTK